MKNYATPAPTNENLSRDAPELEFPDWSGKLPHCFRMTFEQAVRWNDEILSIFPSRKKSSKVEE